MLILLAALLAIGMAYSLYAYCMFRRFCRREGIRLIRPVGVGVRINPAEGYSVIGAYLIDKCGRKFDATFIHRSFHPSKIEVRGDDGSSADRIS